MSSSVLTNDNATQSISLSNPKVRSSISFLVIDDRLRLLSGKFTPFLDFKTPPLITFTTNFFFNFFMTFNSILPSSKRILSFSSTSLIISLSNDIFFELHNELPASISISDSSFNVSFPFSILPTLIFGPCKS